MEVKKGAVTRFMRLCCFFFDACFECMHGILYLAVVVNDLISVLMPVKNAAPFLADCLNSMLAQDTPEWELLAVDDHSSDETVEILTYFEQKDERIHLLKNRGKGIVPALQTAYAASRGTWISRMDADDIMMPDKLRLLRNQLKQSGPAYVVTAFVEMFADEELQQGFLNYAAWLNQLAENNTHYEALYKECVIPSPCWMMSRADFEQIGAFEREVYPEDYDFCFRCYQNGIRLSSVRKVLHRWRDHQQRASRTDEHYADQTFFPLKLNYFLKLDYDSRRPLALWGAGRKGKALAKHLLEKGVDFTWVTQNEKKVGLEIYGKQLVQPFNEAAPANTVFIVAVSGPSHQKEIKLQLLGQNRLENTDFYFFC